MTQFEAVVEYAGKRVKIKSDSFAELHEALSGVEELNQDAAFLRDEKGIEDVVPVHRRDDDENDYFGFQDRHSRKNVTFGKKRGEAVVPFFPKGADGYYDPDAMGGRGRNRRRDDGSRPRDSDRQQRQGRGDGNGRAADRKAERDAGHRRNGREEASPATSDDLPF